MASISELRAGIKTNLATISGLRVSDFQPDSINPPVAIVFPIGVNYDETFQPKLSKKDAYYKYLAENYCMYGKKYKSKTFKEFVRSGMLQYYR